MFHSNIVSFLGYIIKEGEIKTDPDKIKGVKDWPIPINRNQVHHFLDFTKFYRKFIRNPLTSVNRSFSWSLQAVKAFLVPSGTSRRHQF